MVATASLLVSLVVLGPFLLLRFQVLAFLAGSSCAVLQVVEERSCMSLPGFQNQGTPASRRSRGDLARVLTLDRGRSSAPWSSSRVCVRRPRSLSFVSIASFPLSRTTEQEVDAQEMVSNSTIEAPELVARAALAVSHSCLVHQTGG